MRFGVAPAEFNAVPAMPAVLEIASKRCSDRMEARFRSAANRPARANTSLSVGASTRLAGVGPSLRGAAVSILATRLERSTPSWVRIFWTPEVLARQETAQQVMRGNLLVVRPSCLPVRPG